jgi:hypothetical protein
MTTPKTNKQTKLDRIRASLKRARIGHHLKMASITALLAGLYFAGVLTPALYQSYTDSIRAEAIEAYQAGK